MLQNLQYCCSIAITMAEAANVTQEVSQDVSKDMSDETSLEERYVASMVLSGVGDAMGYKNGNWEFCNSGKTIHKECKALGGVPNLSISSECAFELPYYKPLKLVV